MFLVIICCRRLIILQLSQERGHCRKNFIFVIHEAFCSSNQMPVFAPHTTRQADIYASQNIGQDQVLKAGRQLFTNRQDRNAVPFLLAVSFLLHDAGHDVVPVLVVEVGDALAPPVLEIVVQLAEGESCCLGKRLQRRVVVQLDLDGHHADRTVVRADIHNVGLYNLFSIFYVQYSTLLHLPPLRFQCRRMLGSNPGQLRLLHWMSDALITGLDLIHKFFLFDKCCHPARLCILLQF
jgi:hypothetical protein